jgi:hypothetical protein
MTRLVRFAVRPLVVRALIARSRAAAAVVAVSVVAVACRDGASSGAIAPTPTTQQTARLVVETPRSADSMITVALRISRPPAQRVGSITASIVYDSTALRFAGDASPADGALRATHASRGRVMIAVAHTAGFDDDVLARVRFVVRDSIAYRSLGLLVSELHLLDATDVKAGLSILPVEVVR